MKPNYINRIVELIQLSKTDKEIKKIISNEYSIALTEKNINGRRNDKNNKLVIKRSYQNINPNIIFIKKIIEKDSIAKTFKDITDIYLKNYKIEINSTELYQILKTDLKNELYYNSKEYTYALRSSNLKTFEASKNEDQFELSKINGNKPHSDSTYKIIEDKKEPLSYKSSSKILYHINNLVLQEINVFKNSYLISKEVFNQPVNNLKIETLLDSCLTKINIDKPLSEEELNNYIIEGCIINNLFLNEIKLILECFNEKKTKLTEGEIINYLKITRNIDLKTIDITNLLRYDLSFLINRESVYFNTISSTKLNDFLNVVSKEISFYDLYIKSISKDKNKTAQEQPKIETPTDKIITIDEKDNPTTTKPSEKNAEKEVVYESKTSVKNNDFLNTKKQQSIELNTISELLPLSLFHSHVPSKKEFRLNISNVARRLELANSDLHDLKQIKKSILLIQNHLEDESDWELVYENFKQGIEEHDIKFNINGELLIRYAQNPFNYFLLLIESTTENITFNENIRFQKLLKEVCRDNVVSEAEKELVLEKASYFGINHDKVELYLANEFRNYPSFIVLINEICEDGIITQKEREYIEEKAKMYKIPSDSLDKLIAIGLFKVKRLNYLKENIDFQEIVIMYLISSSLELDVNFTLNINQFICTSNEREIFEKETELLNKFKVNKLKKLCELLNDKIEYNLFNLDSHDKIDSLLMKLGLNNLVFNFQETIQKEDKEILNITLDETTYKVTFINIPGRPLFSYKYKNCEYHIKINESHQILLEEKNRELMVNVIVSIIASKSEFSSLESDSLVYKFINKFDSILHLK